MHATCNLIISAHTHRWGKRISTSSNQENENDSWMSLKIFLKNHCNECEAWILSGNSYSTRVLGMKKSRSFSFQIGNERLKWLQYYVFSSKTTNDDE